MIMKPDSANILPQSRELISKPKTQIILIMSTLFLLSIVSAFTAGYFLNYLIHPKENSSTSSTSANTVFPEEEVTDETKSLNGKEYYDDTIIAVTNSVPKKILVATVTRQEIDSGVTQNTRVSFFDGSSWTRKILTKNYQTTAIYTNEIISDWQIKIDDTRVLKQEVAGEVIINNHNLIFNTGVITNNISVRSLPGFTKFMSTNDGYLIVDNEKLSAKILYSRIYSNNSQEIQFYKSTVELTTHWLVFWDENGNIYHIDSTTVDKPTDKYQTHQFAAMVDNTGRVTKTFDVSVSVDNETPPSVYQIKLGSPINKNLVFNIGKSINKAPNNSFKWFMSEGTGQIDGINGYGLVEYIRH